MVNSAKRTVFKLEHPARLILINAHSSYLELKNNGTDSKCIWCASTKPHEHDILGKIKFTGSKEKSYLLSMVEKVKMKNKKGLEITIANDAEAENQATQVSKNDSDDEVLNARSKVTHWTTQEVANEAEGARYLARQLINQNGHLTCASIKYGDRRHVLSSTPKSVLKPVVGKVGNCDKCFNNQFASLTEMQLHFMNVHQYNLQLKDITLVTNDDNANDDDAPEEESRFVCDHCPVEFESDEKKIEHMNEVHGERQCAKCLQHFKTNLTFRKHTCSLRDSKLDRKHPCHLCPKSFLKAPHLRAHLQTHMGAKLYACEICDKRYASAFSLKTHRINTHGVGGVKPQCPHCSRTFCNNTFLRRHILETHEKDSRRTCSICGAFYLRKDKLEVHMKIVHGNTEEVKSCKLCSKSYSSQERLQEHLRTVHGILPWNKVQVCQVSSKPHELNEQELDDDWHLKCKYCEQAMEKGEMENHLRFSHGVMPITSSEQLTISEAAEALLKTLTPQPDYLLRSLTPLPMETLDELIMDSALSKD